MAAGSLRSRRSRIVGVLIPDLSNPIYARLLSGISDGLESDGYTSVIFETRDEDRRLVEALRALQERRVDAVINAAARADDRRRVSRFVRGGTPMVLAARDLVDLDLPKVLNDDLRGGGLAAHHLVNLGHRHLAELAGPSDVAAFVERSRGFRTETLVAGVPAPISVSATAATVAEGNRLMHSLLRRRTPPTAVFGHNDLLAIGAISALRDLGRRCPVDVSVVGYNDTPLTECLDPALSTVRLPAVEMGRVAADTVLALLRGSERVTSVALAPKLVVRASSGPAPTESGRPR